MPNAEAVPAERDHRETAPEEKDGERNIPRRKCEQAQRASRILRETELPVVGITSMVVVGSRWRSDGYVSSARGRVVEVGVHADYGLSLKSEHRTGRDVSTLAPKFAVPYPYPCS